MSRHWTTAGKGSWWEKSPRRPSSFLTREMSQPQVQVEPSTMWSRGGLDQSMGQLEQLKSGGHSSITECAGGGTEGCARSHEFCVRLGFAHSGHHTRFIRQWQPQGSTEQTEETNSFLRVSWAGVQRLWQPSALWDAWLWEWGSHLQAGPAPDLLWQSGKPGPLRLEVGPTTSGKPGNEPGLSTDLPYQDTKPNLHKFKVKAGNWTAWKNKSKHPSRQNNRI